MKAPVIKKRGRKEAAVDKQGKKNLEYCMFFMLAVAISYQASAPIGTDLGTSTITQI